MYHFFIAAQPQKLPLFLLRLRRTAKKKQKSLPIYPEA